jgi:hypothetical protein
MIEATSIANAALDLFQRGRLRFELGKSYPRYYPLTLGGPDTQAAVGFFINPRHLKLQVLDFSDEYLVNAIMVLRQMYPDIDSRVCDRALPTPIGVDDSGIAVRNFMALRVVIDECPTAKSEQALPPDWGYLGDFYRIDQDVLDKQMLCKMVRIDVPLRAKP